MTISGFTPTTALPGLVPGSTIPGSPLLAQQGTSLPGGALLAAQQGATEKPGIGARVVSAMRAAISELRGQGVGDEQIRTQLLAMQAQKPVTLAKRPEAAVKPRTAKKVVHAKTWKTLANPPKAAVAPPQQPAVGNTQLPANATQLPGGTVYSYDGSGNPAVAGLAGLDPRMQQQLGMTPTMLPGMLGQGADPSGPQMNATNQTNLSGLGSALGVGGAVPVLGQPIVTTAAGDARTANRGVGANQSVTNRNANDVDSRSEGFGGYGTPWDLTGGVATPYAPYGPSMTGAYTTPNTGGFFSRLLGR